MCAHQSRSRLCPSARPSSNRGWTFLAIRYRHRAGCISAWPSSTNCADGRADQGSGLCLLLIPGEKTLTVAAWETAQGHAGIRRSWRGVTASMRDLEIRGAGNILGRPAIWTIAPRFDIYCKLMEETIRSSRASRSRREGAAGVLKIGGFSSPKIYPQHRAAPRSLPTLYAVDNEAMLAELRPRSSIGSGSSEAVEKLLCLVELRTLARQLIVEDRATEQTVVFVFDLSPQSRPKRSSRCCMNIGGR